MHLTDISAACDEVACFDGWPQRSVKVRRLLSRIAGSLIVRSVATKSAQLGGKDDQRM